MRGSEGAALPFWMTPMSQAGPAQVCGRLFQQPQKSHLWWSDALVLPTQKTIWNVFPLQIGSAKFYSSGWTTYANHHILVDFQTISRWWYFRFPTIFRKKKRTFYHPGYINGAEQYDCKHTNLRIWFGSTYDACVLENTPAKVQTKWLIIKTE